MIKADAFLFHVLILMLPLSSKAQHDTIIRYEMDLEAEFKNCWGKILVSNNKEEIELSLRKYYKMKRFYSFKKCNSRFYTYKILLDSTLKIINIKNDEYCNKVISEKIMNEVIYKLKFSKSSPADGCSKFLIVFIIIADKKSILYPNSVKYYNDLREEFYFLPK